MLDTTPQPAGLPPGVGDDDGRVLYVQGLLALRDGHADTAATLLTQALRRQPGHGGIRRNLVRALLGSRAFEQALLHADAALALNPDDAELHFARGSALNALGQPTAAAAALSRAVRLHPDHAPSWLNFGNANADLDDLEAAERLYRTAIGIDPSLPEAHASLGYLLTRQGRLTEAIAACDKAIALQPSFALAHWNRAIATLLSGDLEAGFPLYEWRKKHPDFRQDFPRLPGPCWDGSPLDGQTVLVRAEQGLGDAIQFARYLPLIVARGGRPLVCCHRALVPLLGDMPGVTACDAAQAPPPFDLWIDQMSLPGLMGTTLESIPAAEGYLAVDPARGAAWQARLPHGRRVGLALSGNPRHPADRRRSIGAMPELPAISGTVFINLQHGASAASLNLPDLTDDLPDLAETAALLTSLDLVISVDTAMAHLAGALGRPVWVLLPHAPDWRWMLERTDSPWYRSARLFRQPRAGDWAPVLDDVFNTLRHAPPSGAG